ncbi:MAG: hypothetical protein Ct9H300mP16_15560 [Pseudomonadota bacterium]|nr:MAG: hypothetical protein Ct9H300mP16_15560 [Pseudomonadota bacterium]
MSKEGVKVVIMDREFTVACKKNEKDDLLEAALTWTNSCGWFRPRARWWVSSIVQ